MKNKLVFLLVITIITLSLSVSCSNRNSSNVNSKKSDSLTTNESNNNETLSSTTDKHKNSVKIGALAAKIDNNLTIEKMLTYAIQDEYLAKKEYETIIDKYGSQKPFSNIIESEKNHISQLTTLFNKYNIDISKDNSKDFVVLPSSLNEAYKTGVTAEIDNIAMYERFLKEILPQDIKDTFIALRNASENHLSAFQKNTK